MKRFLIVNGKKYLFIRRESIALAYDCAIDICDHSKEIFVHEVNDVDMQNE